MCLGEVCTLPVENISQPSSLCVCNYVINELLSAWGTEFSFWSYNSDSHWWASCDVFGVWCLSDSMLLVIVNHSWKCLCFIDVQIRFGDKLISSCQEQGLELGLVWLVVICRLIVAALPQIRRQQWQWLDPKIRFANKHLHCANACWKDTSLRFSTIILQNNRDVKRI